MYKVQIDVAAESHEQLLTALEQATSQIRAGHCSGAQLLGEGWAEYDFPVQEPLQRANKRDQPSRS